INCAMRRRRNQKKIGQRGQCSKSFDAWTQNPDPCNDLPEKPKGMHQRTYDRLVERYEAYDEQWGLEIMRRFGRRIRYAAAFGVIRDLRRPLNCFSAPS